MGSTNRGRLTSAVIDGRATRVVIRLGVAIELVTGLTLLIIPGVVIRALIGADEGTASTIVGRVLGGALIGLGIAGASARGRTPERPIVLAYVVYNVSTATVLAAASVAGTASGDPALAGGCSARASGFGSPRRPVTRSAVTYGQPVTRHWNLRSIRQPSPRQPGVGAVAADLPDARLSALARQQSVRRRQAASYCRHRPHPVGIRHCPIPSSLVVVWLACM
jgi:hypothetical protein